MIKDIGSAIVDKGVMEVGIDHVLFNMSDDINCCGGGWKVVGIYEGISLQHGVEGVPVESIVCYMLSLHLLCKPIS